MSIEVLAAPPNQDTVSEPVAPALDLPVLPSMKTLNKLLAPYQRADTRKALWQLANTLLPFLGLLYLMIRSLEISYWLTLALALPTAGFMVRLFIFFHDCGHNSFFPSRKANKIVGFLLGVLVWTPSEHWWHAHAVHHATSGNLDKRGTGDVTTLTVEEYQALPLTQRIGYQLFRFPFIMFGLGPIYTFVLLHRLPFPRFGRKETLNVLWTNLAIALVATAGSLLAGSFWNFVLVFLPVIWLAGMGASGCFTCSTSLRESIGRVMRNGTMSPRHCWERPITNCRASCSGFPVTLAFTRSITSARASPITILRPATVRIR